MARNIGRSFALLLAFGLIGAAAEPAGPRTAVSRALIVGGGPDLAHNQVSIESNVRYVSRLLPRRAPLTVLYADGNAQAATVLAEVADTPRTKDEQLLDAILGGTDDQPKETRYRAPTIAKLDGPASSDALKSAFAGLRAAKRSDGPVLLYFTGHGSMDERGDLDNNVYDLWGGSGYSVRQLAAEVAALPADQPVVLVMVQCFSGAFGNLIFEDGQPKGRPVDRDIAGFYAAVPSLPAAGCTPEVNEADYHDFTSYFFAALTGRDRLGNKVAGADYNRDGRVGMDEAFCYTLIHDRSIDVPVCTSDVYLRATATLPDPDVFARPYRDALPWATPAQLAALTSLSDQLKLEGDDRATTAYQRYRDAVSPGGRGRPGMRGRRGMGRLRGAARQDLLARWPALGSRKDAGYAAAYADALKAIAADRAAGKFADLEQAIKAGEDASKAAYDAEIADSRLIRFVRLFKTVVLTHELRQNGDAARKQRLERLLESEQRTVLPRA